MTDDLAFLDAVGTVELVRRGQVTPLEVVDAAIARTDKLNPQLNAVIHERFEAARREAADATAASGPLAGVPVMIKDLHGMIEGEPYHAGIAAAKAAGHRANATSVVVSRLTGAGAVVVGKTNTPELGLFPTTEPRAYGPTANPWDTNRSPGGSSGGSASAVASGMVPVGHANDGGGSIRIPASECGLVGLKPTRGRVPHWPEGAEGWAGLSVDLVVTRTVRDTALLLDVLSGPEPGDVHTSPGPQRPYRDERAGDAGRLRIGVCLVAPDGSTPVHPHCAGAVEQILPLLESLGHRVEPGAYPAALVNPGLSASFLPCYGAWTAHELAVWGARLGRSDPLGEDDVEPATFAIAQMGRETTADQYLTGLESLHRSARAVQQWWEDFDVLVTPTIPEPPLLLGQFGSTDEPLAGLFRSAAVVPFTIPFNISGQPAVSLPLGWSLEGLPIGVQFVGAFGREDVLVRLALQLEEAAPWSARRARVSA